MAALPEDIQKELLALIEKGDEAAARAFVIEHLKAFPQETQDAIIFGLMEEALAQKSREEKLLTEFRADGLAAMEVFEKAKHDLEVAAKAAQLKNE